MRSSVVRWVAIAVLTLSGASCQEVAGPSVNDVLAHRAKWAARGLTSYSFDYTLRAMIYSVGCPAAAWRLQVQQNAVTVATCLATGQAVTPPSVTIDTLFDEALRAMRGNSITAISYDARLGFPTSIEFAGPPDASYSETATNLQP
jgi:uncharacterized protein DUF6174